MHCTSHFSTRIINIAVVVFVLLSWGSVGYSANGSHLIGATASSVALGGTGVALPMSTIDASVKNPSLLGRAQNKTGSVQAEAYFGLNRLNSNANSGTGVIENAAKNSVLAGFGAGYKLNEEIAFGLSIAPHSGATADYRDHADLKRLQTLTRTIRILPTASYQIAEGFNVGIAPYFSYGELVINERSLEFLAPALPLTQRAPHSAVTYSVMLGVSYEVIEGLNVGASFNPRSNFTYKDIVTLERFGPTAAVQATNPPSNVVVGQPLEFSFGASYPVLPELKVTADYRYIDYGNTNTYRELGWSSQNVIALGAEYQLCAFKFRGGFNWAKAPFGTNTSENGFETTNFQGKDIFKESTSNFNTILFPAIVESHITLGAAYNVMEGLEVEASFMFAPKKSVIRAGNGINPLTSQPTRPYSVTATAAQWNALLGVKWAL